MSAKAEKTEFVDNTARRKWDKEEYERKAKERAEKEELVRNHFHVLLDNSPPLGTR